MKNVLIVGAGFLGTTLYRAFQRLELGGKWKVHVFDTNPIESKLQKDFDAGEFNLLPSQHINWSDIEVVKNSILVFVCVPTPMKEDGGCHLGIVESVIEQIRARNKECWICIKSTVPPGTTQSLYEKYGNICFSPEFLTEANAYIDFAELPYQIIGYCEALPGISDSLDCPLEDFFNDAVEAQCIDGSPVMLNATEAEMVKYTRNCYLATRLSYFNEIKQICDKLEIDYRHMKYFAGLDKRIGNHYNEIDEEEPEFSGVCLPKDLNALIHFAEQLGVDPKVSKSVWAKNLEVAKKRTWEGEKGRAVIK